jgi:hypothetical protein
LFYFTKNLPLNCGDFHGGIASTDWDRTIDCPSCVDRRVADRNPCLRGATKLADFFTGSVGTVALTRAKVVTLDASGTRGIY